MSEMFFLNILKILRLGILVEPKEAISNSVLRNHFWHSNSITEIGNKNEIQKCFEMRFVDIYKLLSLIDLVCMMM